MEGAGEPLSGEARAAWGRVRPLYYADPAALPGPSGTHPSCLAEDVPPESIDMVNWWYRQGSREHDARPWLSSIRARTLVLAGRADPLGTPEQAHLLASGIPGAHLHIFERSGHLPQIEEPAAYLDALGQFLTPQSPKPALSGCDA